MQHTVQSEADNNSMPRSKQVNASPREPSVSDSAEEADDVSSYVSNKSAKRREESKRKEVRKASIAWQH